MHFAACNADVERRCGAEFERGFKCLETSRIELQVEESAAPEDCHGEQERVRPLGNVKIEDWLAVRERQRQGRTKADVFQRKHPNRKRRQRDSKTGANAGG